MTITYGQNNGGMLKIGDEFAVTESSNFSYTANQNGIVYSKQFRSEGSGYIKVYFKNFDLNPGDYARVYSPITGTEYFYYGSGKDIGNNQTISEFWSTTIWDDYIIVELYSNSGSGNHYGFDIDRVAYGYPTDKIKEAFQQTSPTQESICSVDNKEAVVCYDGTEMGRKSEAVCRLFIGGGGLCTGWLLGCDGNVMTNNHCVSTTAAANNTEFLFNYQFDDCAETTFASSDLVATSATLIQTDDPLDFTLLLLPVNPTPTYGYLSLSSTAPAVGERIYIPQHPGGRRKEIAVNTDTGADPNGFAQITSAGGLPSRVQYLCDTEGGSSGSPVIRYSDHLVVAIHNTGGCPNGSHGRSDELIAAINAANNMPSCGVDDPNPDSPRISFSNASPSTTENTGCDYQDVDFTLRIAQAPSQNADITVSTSGTALNGFDYEMLTPNPVVFNAGQTDNKIVTVRIYNDAFIEGNEDITLTLALDNNGGDATLSAANSLTHTILDDDYSPNIGNTINFISEDFESNLSSWTITGNGTTNFAIGNATTATSNAWNATGNTTNFVFVNDDACNCDMGMERLTYTNPIDLSNVSTATSGQTHTLPRRILTRYLLS